MGAPTDNGSDANGSERSDEWEERETQAVAFDEYVDPDQRTEEAYLIVISGSLVGSMVKVLPGMTIGRGSQADIRTQDEGVSRIHARIVEAPEKQLAVEDMNSRNGTFVNGERVTKVVLKDGDKIRIGSTTILKFSYADKLEETFQQQMYNAALRDPLTQIYNRRHFDEQLLSEFSYSQRHGTALSLIMMDLDNFKQVNDTYGHLAGDAVLISLGQILSKSIRKEDLYARYGGEEFALLCRGINGPVAFSIANRIRRQVEESRLIPDLPSLQITLSAGVASYPEPYIGSPEKLVEAADRALYQAKALGKNRACIFDEELNPSRHMSKAGDADRDTAEFDAADVAKDVDQAEVGDADGDED
jgi:diguanylate cyclase (GGDEF)-like protein